MNHSTIANGRLAGRVGGLQTSLVAGDLEQVEMILQNALSPFRSRFGPLVKHLNHYRGKRLRPTLLILVAHACGRLAPAHHLLAAVVEMIHTATLVHDDVLDEADTRRHVHTINADWGNKLSILFGDLLFTKAFHLSSKVGDAQACEWIGDATNRVCTGELHQTSERGNLDLTEDDYFLIVEGKTAALTECCTRLGAFYAGASAPQVQRLADFGRDLGIAFQIADDVLDLVGSEQTAGKTLGTDVRQQKMTLPLIYHAERLSEEDARDWKTQLREGNGDRTRLVAELRETGSLESAQARAEQHAKAAAENLLCIPESPYRAMLESIVRWSVRRDA